MPRLKVVEYEQDAVNNNIRRDNVGRRRALCCVLAFRRRNSLSEIILSQAV